MWHAFDFWFRPKRFESECLYERLGALFLKRYVPTGGDLVMRHVRRRRPHAKLVAANLQSVCEYGRRTRLNESIHLVGFVVFAVVVVRRFPSGALTRFGFAVAIGLNLMLGLWPVVLQRYNRPRLYRAIDTISRLQHRFPP